MEKQKTLRADAQRSCNQIKQAARSLFETGDTSISIDAIAKKACIGVGTFYRHFNNRKDLIRAVYEDEIDTICLEGDHYLEKFPAGEALSKFLYLTIEHAAENIGLAQALAHTIANDEEALKYGNSKVAETIERMMIAAADEGSIRPDIEFEVVVAALNRLCSVKPNGEWLTQTKAILAIILDGISQKK